MVKVSIFVSLAEAEYKDIADYIKVSERSITVTGFTGYSLDCQFSYLSISLISLVLLLL